MDLLFLAYGLLALLALWACARDRDLFWVGAWLVLGWAISNLLDRYAPAVYAPGPYTLIEMMVLTATYCAWAEHRRWGLVAIVLFNTASIAANVAFASIYSPDARQVYLWEATTNICFAAQCLLAFGVGVAHGRRTGRFASWPRLRWRDPESHGARRERSR